MLINNGLEKNLGNEEIIIDGYKINKEALKVIKSLNPHHKALMFTLLDIQKLWTRSLTKEVLNECIIMNNKWSKDWYIWVITYMIVQTIKTNFDSGTRDLIETMKKLVEYPIQPIKTTSIRAMFPNKHDLVLKLKPLRRVTGAVKPRKMISNLDENPPQVKKTFFKPIKKEPEDIFEYKLRQYRDQVK